MTHQPDLKEAFDLLTTYNKSEGLVKHGLAVEGVMRYMAKQRGGDEEMWGIVGLVHDLDYEKYPEQHCQKTEEILQQEKWPADYVRAIVSHGWGICSDVKPESDMEIVLYAVDELTGLITATALMRPSKSILDLKAKSVKKKWKNKRFAAGVDREIIQKGADMLAMDRGELITETIMGMRTVAEQIGLVGNVES